MRTPNLCSPSWSCRPIIVTDGGFSFRWFDKVSSLGWDFVGRLRGTLCVTVDGREQRISELFCRASKVIRTYATRMQLEEAFRDLKSSRFGWAFEAVNSKNPPRTEVLLMIGTLASIALLAVGAAAEMRGLASQFQANTVRKRRVLSLCFLGRRVIASAVHIPDGAIRDALTALRRYIQASSPIPFAPI